MGSNITESKGTVRPSKRLLKVAGGIVAILCGLALCLYTKLPVVLLITVIKWQEDTTISNTESQSIDWVLTHAYPNSTMIRADAAVFCWSAGNNVTIQVKVTLESADSFDAIMNWYIQHPEGGRLIREGGDLSPKAWLAKLEGVAAGKTRYRVTYESVENLLMDDCNRPSQQIR
jgi:hypothetical protein